MKDAYMANDIIYFSKSSMESNVQLELFHVNYVSQ